MIVYLTSDFLEVVLLRAELISFLIHLLKLCLPLLNSQELSSLFSFLELLLHQLSLAQLDRPYQIRYLFAFFSDVYFAAAVLSEITILLFDLVQIDAELALHLLCYVGNLSLASGK